MGSVKIGEALIMGVVVLVLIMVAESSPNTFITEWRCNANYYSQKDEYAVNVEYVLRVLETATATAGYDYYTQSPSNTAICYGHATCRSSLTYKDCTDCLSAATTEVNEICAFKIGGMIEMVDCTIRYENYSF